MADSLFDAYGARKYLVPKERAAFVACVLYEEPEFATFCLTLAIAGARISEVLALSQLNIDEGESDGDLRERSWR